MQITQHQMSPKQGSLLFKATGRKFWEHENLPAPTVKEASELISLIMEYLQEKKKEESGDKATLIAQRWFPEFQKSEIRWRFWGKKGGDNHQQQQPEPQTAKQPKKGKRKNYPAELPPIPTPEQMIQTGIEEAKKEEPKPETPVKIEVSEGTDQSEALEYLIKLIHAGIRNIWLFGPAGAGKTTICKLAGERLFLPVTVESCGPGTSPGVFKGFRFPEPRCTPITEALPMAGIIVLDEFTSLQADAGMEANAMLANNEVNTVVGLRVRHPDCVIIVTSNTVGTGGNQLYNGNNQLDAATIDRFACGFLEVGYSKEWELAHGDKEVCEYCWALRAKVKEKNLRRIVSTRSIQAATKLKAAGLDWKAALITTWTADERRAIAA